MATYEEQMESGVSDYLDYCQICHVLLNQPDEPLTRSLGGDCLSCMAEIGDPAARAEMVKLGHLQYRDEE